MQWNPPYLHTIISEDISEVIATDLPWQQLKNKTILITGANGFLPAYLVYSFLALNDCKQLSIKVIALVRNKVKAEEKFGDIIKRNDFELLIQDVCDPILYENNVDYIIHAASQASPVYYGVDPVGTLAANTIGTYNLLNFAVKNKSTGFLFFSSGEVYGEVTSDKIPTKENEFGYVDISNVRSCYAESKRLAEVMCVSFAKQFKLAIKIVRPFHTYGPGMNLNDGRVYSDFVADIVNSRNITLKSEGNATRAFCYLRDATIGFLTVLLKGENGEAYNVGNPSQEVSIKKLANILVSLFAEKKLLVNTDLSSQGNLYLKSTVIRNAPAIEKIERLGWTPTTSIQTGFNRTIKYFIENTLLDKA